MTLSVADRDGRATVAAAEGQVALAKGDTPRAREKLEEAGAILEVSVANTRKQSEKHLLRFLAASQYFKGGLYQKALDLCAKIQMKLLPAPYRSLYSRFLQDTKPRAHPGYESRIRRQVLECRSLKQPVQLLELLQEHPYVMPPDLLAYLRAKACEELQDFRAAALFYAAALRYSPGNTNILSGMVSLPLKFPQQGRLEDSWTYIHHLLELVPHPATFALASLLCFRRALVASAEDRRRLFDEQVRYFEEAWRGYQKLPAKERDHPVLRSCMTLCGEAAAVGQLRLGDEGRAQEISDAMTVLDPHFSIPGTVRGEGLRPGDEEQAIFEHEARLSRSLDGDDSLRNELLAV